MIQTPAQSILLMIINGLILAATISIPVYIVWLLFKAAKRISHLETIEQELVKLREEVHTLRESLNGKKD